MDTIWREVQQNYKMPWTTLLVKLLCISILVHVILGDISTQVSYFSFISSIQNDTQAPSSSVVVYSLVLQADDAPFERLDLPWKFNFLGENIYHLFVNPNGALHASDVQPCPPLNYFTTGSCQLSNSYYNVIGGLLTDLIPYNSSTGNITSYIINGHMTVEYHNIAYYGTAHTNSFRFILHEDSHIELAYDKITKIPSLNLPMNNLWTSGLRSFVQPKYAYFSSEQRSFVLSEWGKPSNATGVFPRKADISTGNQFNICPVSRGWCVSPAVISTNVTVLANPSPYITFTASLLSCASAVQYGVIFKSTLNETYSVACLVLRNVSLQCSIADLVVQNISVGEFAVTPAWRRSASADFIPLPVDHLWVSVKNTSLFDVSTEGYAVGCANNLYDSACAGDSCALCQGNYSCLSLPCINSTTEIDASTALPGLTNSMYDRVTCAGTCPVFNTNTSEMYFTDYTQQCCALSQADCSGRCNGTAQIAYDANVRSEIVCCSERVDCAGICNGTTVVDICGECGGNNVCYETSDVSVLTVAGEGTFYPVYEISAGSGGYSSILQLNITNRSRFVVRATFSELSTTLAVTPVLTMPGPQIVQPYGFTIVNIPSSIATLLTSNTTTWANKFFEVVIQRTTNPDPQLTVPIYVNPRVTGCSVYPLRTNCLRLPGCIFCYVNPLMRILRQEAPADESANSESSSSSLARKLFIELVPWSLADPGDSLDGVCTDGYVNQDCAVAVPNAFVNNAQRRTPLLGIVGSLGTLFLWVVGVSFLY